jgi:hypothetical protein
LAQSAQRPAGPAATHLFSNRSLPLSPLGISLSAGPARHLGPADRASVAPCPIAASHSRKRISRKPPSLHECVLRRKSATSARPISIGPATIPPPALACRPAQTTQPTWPLSRSARACLWRILQKTFSSLIHAFRSWCLLSLPSLTHGPYLSALSSTPRRPTPIAPPPSPTASGLSARRSAPQDAAPSRYSPHHHSPLFKSHLNPP